MKCGAQTAKGKAEMDANVRILMDTTGCTETEAQQVLIEANNEVSKALQLLDAAQKGTTVFQIEFSSTGKTDGRGFFIAIFDLGNDNNLYSDLVYPITADQARMLDANMPPTVFANSLRTARMNLSERHRGICSSNLSTINGKMTSHFVQKILSLHNSAQYDKINSAFGELFKDAFAEDFTVQYLSRSASLGSISTLLRPRSSGRSAPEDAASKLFPDEPDTSFVPRSPDDIPAASPHDPLPQIVLICEPDIAPFNGKPAREVIEGDEIIVKIKDGRESARYFAELLGGCISEQLIPLIVPVVKINKVSETFVEGFVEFGPGIFGQFFIPPDVKIKTKAEGIEIYNPFQDEQSLFAEERWGRQILWGLGVLAGAVVVLIFVLSLLTGS